MNAFWKILRWVGFAAAAVLLGGILYFGVVESYIYLTRSEAKARAEAQGQFVRICDQLDLDPNSFRGPERPKNAAEDQYIFVWTRSPEETISVSVAYLPHDFPSSFSEAIHPAKYHAGSKP
jgi:hypothetical protein